MSTPVSGCKKSSSGFSAARWNSSWPRRSATPISARRWKDPGYRSTRLEERKYLFDIEQAISRLERFTEDRDFADYERDDLLRAAVERQFEIIGEALAKLAKIAPELAARIPEHRRIIAFRNLLIHGYAEVDHRLVWDILQSKLPGLRAAVASLLGAQPDR